MLLQERDFMIYGLWLGTVICLAGAILFSALGAIFAVVNTATNPVESAFGVSGLYVWNSVAGMAHHILFLSIPVVML